MANSSEDRYTRLLAKANEYHRQALWQEKLRILQEALQICEEADFENGDERRQLLLYDVAGIWRRLGQYDKAKTTLDESLAAFPSATNSFRTSVLGELGVMARHENDFLEAQRAFREQGRLARESPPSLEADAEICRALGNEGMASYNLWQRMSPPDPALLAAATEQMKERVSRAQDLQGRLKDDTKSKLAGMAEAWEIIGLDRLTLLRIAAGETEEALRVAEESQRKQKREDPTVTAFSKFFYGNALWHNGQREQAVKEWNAPDGVCSSPMAFCKEPSQEHNTYMQLMADAGVNFDSYDESGFSALDHAALGHSQDHRAAEVIIEGALRRALYHKLRTSRPTFSEDQLQAKVNTEISTRKRQAELRRQYRAILQEHIRPELRSKTTETFRNLRTVYSNFLTQSPEERRVFGTFKYVKYRDFLEHGRLPISNEGLQTEFVPGDHIFVVFFSYRWIGGGVKPDNENNEQWRRMVAALKDFLTANPTVGPERLGIWIDYGCVDQVDDVEKERGIDALPLAVTQCNAMISLVDDKYYERAWCVVEVMLIRSLVESYGLHKWFEHSGGSLRKGEVDKVFDIESLKLSEEGDRPKIDFLLRQSKLLGKDNA